MSLWKAKLPFWVFPCARWNPYFCSVWWFCMVTTKCHFPKEIVVTKCGFFYLPNTNSVCQFSKKCHFNQKDLFSSQPPKKLFSCLFWKCPFPFFHFLSFAFSNIKKTKQKNISFRKPFFDTPTTCQKTTFAPLHTICDCDFKLPQNPIKLGKTSKKIRLFDSTGPIFAFFLC